MGVDLLGRGSSGWLGLLRTGSDSDNDNISHNVGDEGLLVEEVVHGRGNSQAGGEKSDDGG